MRCLRTVRDVGRPAGAAQRRRRLTGKVLHHLWFAEAPLARARTLPGFRDEPGCSEITTTVVDEVGWPEGFG